MKFRLKRRLAEALINGCGLWRLHDSSVQLFVRTVLDEIDFQHMRNTHPCPEFTDRLEMYRHINKDTIKGNAIDYLEFGVFRGESMRSWVKLNVDKNSRFYGFDSFEGLPETWRQTQPKGHFNVDGNVPQIDDSRVTFVKGWFGETVPEFIRNFTAQNRLVVHLDADLYSSSMVALIYLSPYLKSGSLLIFDEFYDRDHEFKAFQDYLRISRNTYRVVCNTARFAKTCIELI